MTTIRSLPPELFISICRDLEVSDLCAVRLTCRALTLRTSEYFAKRVFKAIHVAITSEGMKFLQTIAAHEFRLYIQELWIVPDLFGGHDNWTAEEIAQQQRHYRVKTPQSSELSLGFQYSALPEKAIEDCLAIYQHAVTDHLHAHHNLQKTLESCLPYFLKIDAVGFFWNPECCYGAFSKERTQRKIHGVSRLKQQLGFDPLNPIIREKKTVVPKSGTAVLSTFLTALATTNMRIKSLYTEGGASGGIIASTGLHLTSAERGLLTSVLHGLQHLTLSLWSSYEEDEDRSFSTVKTQDTILSILAEAAPSISSLTISQGPMKIFKRRPGLVTVDRHVDWLSQHFYFNHLWTLTLSNIIVTVASLETLLASALSTLKKLKLSQVAMTSEHILTSKAALLQGVKLWREVCVFLRDNSSLQAFDLGLIQHQWERIGIFDPVHGNQGLKPLVRVSNHARYLETRSDITFREWIDQVDFRSFFHPSTIN